MQHTTAGDCDEGDGIEEQQGKSFDEDPPLEELGNEGAARQGSRLNQNQQSPPTAREFTENHSEISHNNADVTISSREYVSNDPLHPLSLPLTELQNLPSINPPGDRFERPQIDLDGMTLIEVNAHQSPKPASSASSYDPLLPISDHGERAHGLFQPHKDDTQDQSMLAQSSLLLDSSCYTDSTGYTPWTGFPSTDAHYLSGFEFVPEEPGYESPQFHLVGDNSWKIEEACLCYIGQHFNISGLEPSLHDLHRKDVSHYDALRTAIPSLDIGDSIVADVARLAVDIMCKTSGFSRYIYGVGANRDMEKVFQWRLSPSMRNRLLIPEPFQLTPLQYMRKCNYPVAIDFVNWPSIRDQLIFKAGTYDCDQVIADIVANTVIEIPERRVAINIHDTFFTKIFSLTAAADHSARYAPVTHSPHINR